MKYYYNNYGAYYKNAERLPVNKPVWAIAYNINDDTERKRLSCKPTLGEIINADESGRRFWTTHCFVPYKKGTTEKRKSGFVDFQARLYADTYEEAVEMYNELVQKRISKLEQMIEEAKKDLIL